MTTRRMLAALAVLTLLTGACKKSSTSPSATETSKFTATLSPANEVPAITNAEAGASGTATITLNVTKDSAGAITAATADFNVTYSGFPNGTALTLAHIHSGNAGTNGGVVVNTAIAAGEVTFPAGSGTLNKTGVSVDATTASSIVANPSGFYFNSHTALNPGGALRGQLVKVQ